MRVKEMKSKKFVREKKKTYRNETESFRVFARVVKKSGEDETFAIRINREDYCLANSAVCQRSYKALKNYRSLHKSNLFNHINYVS